MHEGALTEDLFEHVLTHAREAGASRVRRVKVSIGALSDATPESIEFYFNSLAPGTLAEGAVLEFASVPGTAHCNTCGRNIEVDDLFAACPNCGSFPVAITGGNGVYLSSLEIETEDNQQEHIHE
ncbi:MAG: hydrogenase maturation nickel metallochaperone HypA [Anaerolineales bacterium]|jgi:hydrogenase nickel incorporation protein HypA/HybF